MLLFCHVGTSFLSKNQLPGRKEDLWAEGRFQAKLLFEWVPRGLTGLAGCLATASPEPGLTGKEVFLLDLLAVVSCTAACIGIGAKGILIDLSIM